MNTLGALVFYRPPSVLGSFYIRLKVSRTELSHVIGTVEGRTEDVNSPMRLLYKIKPKKGF